MKSDLERVESKAIRELRKKNQRLANEVKRLRKMIKNSDSLLEDEQDENLAEEFDQRNIEPIKTPPKPMCPKCHKEGIHVFELIERKYFKCEECGAKGRYIETQ